MSRPPCGADCTSMIPLLSCLLGGRFIVKNKRVDRFWFPEGGSLKWIDELGAVEIIQLTSAIHRF